MADQPRDGGVDPGRPDDSERVPSFDSWPDLEPWIRRYRSYLVKIANDNLGPKFLAKVDASDVIQEAFLKAGRAQVPFRGGSHESFLAWMRVILEHAASDIRRRYQADRRRIDREVPLPGQSDDSGADPLADTGTSVFTRMTRVERAQALALAVARLPEHDRKMLQMRHQEGLTFEQIADRSDMTAEAARKRWARALLRLRDAIGPLA